MFSNKINPFSMDSYIIKTNKDIDKVVNPEIHVEKEITNPLLKNDLEVFNVHKMNTNLDTMYNDIRPVKQKRTRKPR